MITANQRSSGAFGGAESIRANMDMRRLSKFQSFGLFADDKTGVRYSRATSASELSQAYRLVHDIFVEKGYILPSFSALRIRPYEASRDTSTFVAEVQGKIVASVSVVVDSTDLGLPSDCAFHRELNELRNLKRKLCEATNFAIYTEYRSSSVCTELIRCALAQALVCGQTDMICSVSPQQKKFYEFMGLTNIGDRRNYAENVDDPVVNMRWDIAGLSERWGNPDLSYDNLNAFWKNFFLTQNPYISMINRWAVCAGEMFDNLNELMALFGNCKELFLESKPSELEAIKARLGSAFRSVYRQATGAEYDFRLARLSLSASVGIWNSPVKRVIKRELRPVSNIAPV